MLKEQRGSASLEFLIVFVPWIIVIFIFFNLLFLLGSLMINQATVTRAAQQVAAAGCLPEGLPELTEETAIGAEEPRFVVRSTPPGPEGQGWNRDQMFNDDGTLAQGDPAPQCQPGQRSAIPSGHYIYVQLQYRQYLPMVSAVAGVVGGSGYLEVNRGALAVSQSLEAE